MRWESEKWRKLYRRVDASWLRLPLLARGIGSELLKYADDDGRIAVMADEGTGEAVCRIMAAHKGERKAVGDLADKLVADGYLVREAEALLIRNFTKAQCRSSNAERQARYRDRHRDSSGDVTGDAESNVTSNEPRNGQVTGAVTSALPNGVTDRALCLSLSGVSDPISADQIPEVPVTASARDSEPRAEPWTLEAPGPTRRAKRSRPKQAEGPLPVNWQPSEAHRAFAAKHGIDLDTEVFGFRGWAEGKLQASWNGAFSTRLSNKVQWAAERAAKSTTVPFRGPTPQPGAFQILDKNPDPVSAEERERPLV